MIIILSILCLVTVFFAGYTNDGYSQKRIQVNTPRDALIRLISGNDLFIIANTNRANISRKRRFQTAHEGQNPYAAIVTCSDSRLSPEHIFQEGIGDLFVVRTAGNVLSNFDISSLEYAAFILGVKVIIIMGHSNCGAVSASILANNNIENNHIENIINEIKSNLENVHNLEEAIIKNDKSSMSKLLENELFLELIVKKELVITSAHYEMKTGKVTFFY